jgi:gas vesicle protein
MSEKNGDLLRGLFIGGLIGMALGILFAPKSGKETRGDITRRADELLARAKEEYEKAVEKNKAAYKASVKDFKDLETSTKEKMIDAEGKVNEFVYQGAEVIQNGKNRLKKAIDAGLEAYREENNRKTV